MTLEERVETLERRCRRLTFTVVLLVGSLGGIALVGAAPRDDPGALRATKLEIIDPQGRTRIALGPADDGFGMVAYDAEGAFRATLTDAPGGAALQLIKGGGQIKLLATEEVPDVIEPEASISLRDGAGRQRALLSVGAKGQSNLRLYEEGGEVIHSALPDPK